MIAEQVRRAKMDAESRERLLIRIPKRQRSYEEKKGTRSSSASGRSESILSQHHCLGTHSVIEDLKRSLTSSRGQWARLSAS